MSDITVNIVLDRVLYERSVNWPTVPRVGDLVELTEGGWGEAVQRVWFNAWEGTVAVELGDHVDGLNEGLADALLKSGWRRPYGGAA